MTTSHGAPVDDNENSLTAGEYGPVLIQDFHLIDKLAHFDRQRIPERVVHAKGAGAHGYFEVTKDVTKWTKAKLFNTVGKKTPLFARFSTVGGEKGTADTERDPRGFAIKFYTEDGIYDLVGNNTPVFFIRDPLKFPDFIHTQKRNPQSNLKDPNAYWDFLSLHPESVHQVTILFSDRGTPDGFRHMDGFGSHTFKWVNDKGEAFFIKYRFKTDAGIKNLTDEEAKKLKGEDPDYATRDLFEHLASGKEATWTLKVQVMPEAEAANYKWNIFDVTKVWPHKDYPEHEVGKMVLNRNPENYFAETEQVAFSPAHMVPGIEPTPDKMLQGRLFSYTDTHMHRLGPNHMQIPINCPYKAFVNNGMRDGFMSVTGNQGSKPNYEPNSEGEYQYDKKYSTHPYEVTGKVMRYEFKHPNDDFAQPRALYRDVMTDKDRDHLIHNIVGHLCNAKKHIQERQVRVFYMCDPEYGKRVAEGLGFSKDFDFTYKK